MPQLNQARAIFWEPLVNLLENQPWVKSINRSDFRIKFNGRDIPDLLVRGCDDHGNRLRGFSLIFCGLDEVAQVDSDVFDTIITPALARNRDSKAVLCSTPLGKSNHWFNLCERAKLLHDWQLFEFKSADNPWIPRSMLRSAKLTLPPKTYRQEFHASFEDFEGQIFSSLLDKHLPSSPPDWVADGNIREIFLGCDWGDTHAALSVIAVSHGVANYHLLDAWESGGIVRTEYEVSREAIRLCRLHNVRRAFLPDDRPASILAFRRVGKTEGVAGLQRSVQVNRGQPGLQERLGITDSLFYQNRLTLNKNLGKVCQDFKSYHRATVKGVITENPAPGQDDHVINSAMYVLGHLEFKHSPQGQIPRSQISAEAIAQIALMAGGLASSRR